MKHSIKPLFALSSFIALSILGGAPTYGATWNWDSPGSWSTSSIPPDSSGSSGTFPTAYTEWGYDFNGSFTRTANSSGASVSISNGTSTAYAAANGTGSHTTYGLATGDAHSSWYWTGSPGSSTVVTLQIAVSLTGWLYADAQAHAAGNGQHAYGLSWANGSGGGTANYGSSHPGQGGGAIVESYTEMEAGFIWDIFTYINYSGSATLSNNNTNETDGGTYSSCFSVTDYSVSVSQSYQTTSSISAITADADITMTVDAEAVVSGGAPGGGGVSHSNLSGSASIAATF